MPCHSAIYLKVKAELGPAVCRNMFFLHAILGCDTTSRPYGTGKAASLKKYGEPVYFQDQVFDIPVSTQAEVATAGENAIVVLYGGKQGDFLSLDSLGYRRYYEKVATRGQQRQPQNLPSTSSAARYHSLRVFSCNQVIPVTTDHFSRFLAQDDPLQLCNWLCLSARCSCRKHGLDCSSAYGQCRGTAGTNISAVLGNSDDEEDI